jgi:hypothetical protein
MPNSIWNRLISLNAIHLAFSESATAVNVDAQIALSLRALLAAFRTGIPEIKDVMTCVNRHRAIHERNARKPAAATDKGFLKWAVCCFKMQAC